VSVRVWIGVVGVLVAPGVARAGVCDVQDPGGGGCGTGECCYYDADEAPVCAPGGAGTQDATCDASDTCACGHVCIGLEGLSTCAAWCGTAEPDDAACPTDARCSVSLTALDDSILGYVCRTPDLCDPIGQDCEDLDAGCYVINRDGTTDCARAGDGVDGATCDYQNDCERGYGCVQGTCSRFCDPTGEGIECGELPCTETPWVVPGTEDPIGQCGDFGGGDSDSDADADAGGADAGPSDDGGCGCRTSGGPDAGAIGVLLALVAISGSRRRGGRRSRPS